ncbi:hypothetical protein [Streptomyces griseosporeus]|uniref:hypothetical protein n=1 Tax=Streptomyces griseosporeus TaxID=1910 RepID=UPI00167E40F4|nr:hypothetical protein [Streptomyces griseosporeus]GHF70545.1 hypothetical protein GCM10018783_45210 [Streptomyces griseosporeus]
MEALVEWARDALRGGTDEVGVCVDLTRQTGDVRTAALATCLALGLAREEAERRLDADEAALLVAECVPGDEEGVVLLLQAGGLFVVDRRLGPREERVRELLGAAIAAYGRGVPSGFAVSLSRWLRGGQLSRAYLQLASDRRRVRADGDPAAYWAALVEAGELLPDGDGIEPARAHCRRMAAQHAAR